MPSYGTRQRQTTPSNRAPQGFVNSSFTRDIGMSKLVEGLSVTFVNSSTQQAQAANGSFTPFAVDDQVEFLGSNLNGGVFTVKAIDTVNHSYLTLWEGCKNEGPITVTVRTP